jgi:hypothetical protein
MVERFLRGLRPDNMTMAPALACAVVAVALVASAAAPEVASPAAWTELEFRVLESNESHTLVEVLIPAPEFRSVDLQGRTFDAITVPGASPLGEAGEPLLSVAGTLIAVPPTAGVELRVLEEGHDLFGNIVPVPGRDADWSTDRPLVVDAAAYSRPGFSLPHAEIGEPAIMRDFRVVPLRIFPLSYDGSARELRATRRLLLELDYSSAGRTNIKTTNRPASRAFRELYEGSIANYDFVRPRYESDSRGKYLIITHDNYYDSVLPLAEWKHRRGMEVEIARTSVIGGSASQIKSYIQTAYNTWFVPPEFILLVGDTEYVPTSSGTDDYYAKLEGSDYLIDACIGRLSADSVADCDLIVAKTLGYERTPYMSDPDWFSSACLIVRDDYDEDDAIYYGDTWLAYNYMVADGFTHIDTLFAKHGADYNDVHAAVTDGRAMVNYRGQGVTNWWPPFSVNPNSTNPGYKLPVVMSATCASGSFGSDGYPCETWMRAGSIAAPRGSVAFLGTSKVISGGAQYRSAVNQGYHNGIFSQGLRTTGEALVHGKLNLYNLYGNQNEYEGWNCQGDPELDIWSATPIYPDVSYPPAVQTGPSVLDISVTDGGSAVVNALVCAYKPGEIYQTGYTDGSGDVSFSIDPSMPDTMWITVTGHNVHPYEGHVVVTANGPYLAYAGHVVDDSSTGNNDGLITPGETIELTVSLENLGPEGATGVNGVLRSPDGYATPGDSTASYGDVPSGGSAANAVPFTFTPTADCPNGHELDLLVRVTDASARGYWNAYVPGVVVSAADLAFTSATVGDGAPGGDGDGLLEPGETSWLDLTVVNNGALGLMDVSGTLATTDPFVAVTDAAGEFGDLGIGEGSTSTSNSFRVNVSPLAPPAHEVSFTLTLEGDGETYTHTQSHSFTVTIEGVPSSGPSGPDAYGYYAYDDGDTWTGQAPAYSWIDLTGLGGTPGNELTELDYDAATTTIPLPFTFRYYGVDYTEISICSNGFLALGSEDYIQGDNSGIPNSHGPEAMVAPFWEDLDPSEGGAIYEKYDNANHRWVCQFNGVVHNGGSNPETFEVVLYDPAYQSNPGGNGDVVLQYHTVSLPFTCTVGIENPAETTGIQYLYNSTYDPAATQLHAGLAVRFTTSPPAAPSQWLAVSDTSVDDSSGGNGDGLAQPLETVDLVVTVENLGSETAGSVTGTITTSDPDVVIDVASSSFGDIPVGGTRDNSSAPFRVSVVESPSDEFVEFDLQLTSTDARYDSYDVVTVILDLDQTGIDDGEIAAVFALHQNSPNPFRTGTAMSFNLPAPERATISVYNVAGRKIANVVDREFGAGRHDVTWNGRDADGRPVPAGIYFYRLEAGGSTSTRKMIVLR